MVLFQRVFHAGRLALMLSQSRVTTVFIHSLILATCSACSPAVGALVLVGICAPCLSSSPWAQGLSMNSASFWASSGSLLLARVHCACISKTEPSLGWAYST